MATTTNYNWATPDDTDLVKDGASAIRTLGSSIDTSFAADQGDLLLGGTTDIFEPLAIGAAATVLTSDGTTASWVAPAGGGKVLQVISATYSTTVTNGTNVYADTGLTATITPSLATSKILVIVAQNGVAKRVGNAGSGVLLKLMRGASDIALIAGYTGWTGTSSEMTIGSAGITYLDSPATTSATTYKTQFRNDVNATNVQVQQSSDVSTITLLEIGA
jgi:hypothetical protein